MKTVVIADEDTVLGFSLAGVEGVVVRTVDEIRDAFERTTRMDDVGIVLITERIAQEIREIVDKWVIRGRQPLVVEIPDRQGALEGRRTLHEFVKSAIGVKF